MANWGEDDWESSSPIGSPSADLPQSIRDVLESVRAEYRDGAFGAFASSHSDKSNNVRHLHPRNEKGIDTKEMVADSSGHRTVYMDQEFRKASSDSQLQEAFHDLTKSDSESSEEVVKSRQPLYIKNQKNVLELPQIEDAQPMFLQELELTDERVCGLETEIQKHQVHLSDKEHLGLIKIDRPSYTSSSVKVEPMTEQDPEFSATETLEGIKRTGNIGTQMEVFKRRMLHKALKRKASTDLDMSIITGETTAQYVTNTHNINSPDKLITESLCASSLPQTQGNQCINLDHNPKSPRLVEGGCKRWTTKKASLMSDPFDVGGERIWAAEYPSMKVVKKQNLGEKTFRSEKQVTELQPGEFTDPSETKVNPNSRFVDVEVNSASQNQVDSMKPGFLLTNKPGESDSSGLEELVDESDSDLKVTVIKEESMEDRKYRNHCSTSDSSVEEDGSPKEKNHLNGFKRAVNKNQHLGETSTRKKQKMIPLVESFLDRIHSERHDEDTKSNKTKNNKNLVTGNGITVGETEYKQYKQLKEKCMTMHSSKDLTKEEYLDPDIPLREEIDDFARPCEDSPMKEVKDVKVDHFIDEGEGAMPRNSKKCSAKESTSYQDHLESNRNVETDPSKPMHWTIWRKELLSSDFNLMYSSLRAVLMGNLSKDDRSQLIQTMLSTMSEIEDITMGEGTPTAQSVRCETPELCDYVDEMDQNDAELDVTDDENESGKSTNLRGSKSKRIIYDDLEPKKEALLEYLRDKSSLREREQIMNAQRLSHLMKINSGGTMTCLVCEKSGLPFGKVCRACSAMAYRIEKNYTIGIPIPTCYHEDYSGGPKCKSCRFRKFSFMSMTDTDTRVRAVNQKMCPICRRTSYYSRGWKCTPCHYFFVKLTRRAGVLPMPICKHTYAKYPATCDGCRCYSLQEEWPKYEKERSYPFPLVTKNHIKRGV